MRAEQALFLRRGGDDDGVAIRASACADAPRGFDDHGDAAGVIDRAIADAVLRAFGAAQSDMVPMAHHRHRSSAGASAGQAGDDVVAVVGAAVAGCGDGGGDRQQHAVIVWLGGGGARFGRIEPGCAQQRIAGGGGDDAFGLRAADFVGKLDAHSRETACQRRKGDAIVGHQYGGDGSGGDQGGAAIGGGHGVLIRPVTKQQQRDLAAHIGGDASVGGDPIADIDQRRADRHLPAAGRAQHDVVDGDGGAARGGEPGAAAVIVQLDQRHRLIETAIARAADEAETGEMAGYVMRG